MEKLKPVVGPLKLSVVAELACLFVIGVEGWPNDDLYGVLVLVKLLPANIGNANEGCVLGCIVVVVEPNNVV